MLNVDKVTKIFNPGTINEKLALDSVSLYLKPGDLVTVIGGNGAGKSTLLNCVAGVYRQEEGSIVLDGLCLDRLPEHKRAKYLGRVFQDPLMGTAADMEIQENLYPGVQEQPAPRALLGRNGQRKGQVKGTIGNLGTGAGGAHVCQGSPALRRPAPDTDPPNGND
jgi:ABC-type uncharacterized transport system ATPase component